MATNWKDLLSTFNTITSNSKSSQSHAREIVDGKENKERTTPLSRGKENLFSQRNEQKSRRQSGVILTNTRTLAYKYYADERKWDNIVEPLKYYIELLRQFGIDYTLIDVSTGQYGDVNEQSVFTDYVKILDAVCESFGIVSNTPYSLFIIGGHDVIPMARLHNPGQMDSDERMDPKGLDNSVDSDLPYVYPACAIKLDENKNLSLDALSRFLGEPRFFVGRLPLENGFIKTTFEDDICSYLERALDVYAKGGISINAPLMTTCWTAYKVAEHLIKDIPVVEIEDSDISINNMFVSPELSLNEDRRIGAQSYAEQISNSDMLIFLLHGGRTPSNGFYYGEYQDEDSYYQPIAFIPDLLKTGSIKSIATVSCYGAKFIDYDRSCSTLLSAIYHDTLCFLGSSRSAWGDLNSTFDGSPRWSIRLMDYYLHLLFSGIPGGEALSHARVKYMNEEVHREQRAGLNVPFLTILEFNFFGDPFLRMLPRINLSDTYAQNNEKYMVDYKCDGDGWKTEYRTIAFNIDKSRKESILDRVRGLVDERFEQIQSILTDSLYKEWGLKPANLYDVCRYNAKDGRKGFCLRYRYGKGTAFSDTVVSTDLEGNILNIYHSY